MDRYTFTHTHIYTYIYVYLSIKILATIYMLGWVYFSPGISQTKEWDIYHLSIYINLFIHPPIYIYTHTDTHTHTYIYIYIYILNIYIRGGNGTPLQYSCLENPMDRGAWWAAVRGVATSQTRLSDFTFTFHFHALEKEMATHSTILAWRIPGTGEPGGLPSVGSHRVGHDWSNLAAAAAAELFHLKTSKWIEISRRMPKAQFILCTSWIIQFIFYLSD